MVNSSDKRKNFRFPAYDDEVGVKLVTKKKRDLFQENSESAGGNETKFDDVTYEEKYIYPIKNKEIKPEKRAEVTFVPKLKAAKPALNRQWQQPQPKEDLFGNHHKREKLRGPKIVDKPVTFRNNSIRDQELEKKLPEKFQARSSFTPKHIPASVIPEDNRQGFNKREAAAAMKNSKSNFLLLDHSVDAVYYEKKKETDPTVQRFNPRNERPIPVTRRQFQQINKDASNLSDEELDRMLPQTRREIQQAKLQGKNATPYVKKQEAAKAVPEKKKHSRLEKSLTGIIEEETAQEKKNLYFD